jgi:dolichyl-diphosphooligosaccharide--protein glycosyltransferase
MKISLDLFKTLIGRFWVPFCLILIFLTVFFIRVFFSWEAVFSDPIKYSADDGIYHMRLVENMLLGGHFPFRIYFDPLTNFPYGTYIHFTPLYDWLLAIIIWIISFGKPTLEIINKIAPFYPAVMGALLIFVVYFITKILFKNRGIAILASFLSGISPSFLYRSTLGNTDHHVAEVLFSTLFMVFFIMVLQNGRNLFGSLKFWILAISSGFFLGLYFLAWTGAIMFLFLTFCFIALYYLIEYFLGNRQNWILYSGIIIYLISFLMIAPFFGHPDLFNTYMYNILHLESFLLGILVFIILLLSDRLFLKKNINPKLMPIFLVCVIFLVLSLFNVFLPDLFSYLISGVKEVNTGMVEYPLARELVGEMAPASFNGLVGNFYAVFIVSLISLGIIFYQFLKNRKPEYFLMILWTIFMMLMAGIIPYFGQVRFSYYLSPIFSILFSFAVIYAITFGWQGLQKSKELEGSNTFKKYILIGSVVMIFNGIYFLFYPFPFNAGADFPKSLPYIIGDIFYNAKMSPAEEDRYEVVEWLKNNTPDPGLDYYELYKEPGADKDTRKVNAYAYPESAYGILAVWDFGHMITYYGHRIPVSNPFQQGIGRKNEDGSIRPGYATFFLERDENAATGYLDQLKTRYVISDSASVNSDGVFQQMIKWAQDNYDGYLEEDSNNLDFNKYYDSTIARLHLFDGRQTSFETKIDDKEKSFNIKPLSHFRLLYESDTTGFTLKIDTKNDVKNYKIFEYVKGAVIKGFALTGTEIKISSKITTNQNRDFIYENSVKSENGKFEIIVPYSTGLQENSETKAEKYKIKIGNYTKEIEISEDDILNGKIINI